METLHPLNEKLVAAADLAREAARPIKLHKVDSAAHNIAQAQLRVSLLLTVGPPYKAKPGL